MIGLVVDVKESIVGLHIRSVQAITEVQCYIKKINSLVIDINCNLQAIFLKKFYELIFQLID